MAKLYKFVAYVADANGEFDSAQDYVDYLNNSTRYGGYITAFDSDTVEVEWDDDIDVNYFDCTKEKWDAHFKIDG